MKFAKVVNGQIVDGEPPFIYYREDGTSIDLRDRDLETLASLGYLPVIEVPKPEDTPTTSYELTYGVVDGKPTQIWEAHTLTQDELAQNSMLQSLEARVTALEALVLTLVPSPTPTSPDVPDWVPPTGAHDAVPPDALRKFPDGSVRRNISGGWLVHDFLLFPMGWKIEKAGTTPPEEPPPTTIPDWKVDTAYKVGDKVKYLTLTYECIQAHTSQVGWTPVVVSALWKRV